MKDGIAFTPAVELPYLTENEQTIFDNEIQYAGDSNSVTNQKKSLTKCAKENHFDNIQYYVDMWSATIVKDMS